MRRCWLWLLAAVLLAASSPALAKDPVAVVELQSSSKRLTVDEVQFVTDMVREAARNGLDPARYVVMTRETMEVMVPAPEMRCMAGTCLIDIGKRLQASFVVGGGLKDFGGEIAITLEAYETQGGTLKGATTETAADVKDAGRVVRIMAAKLIRQMTGQPGSGATESSGGRNSVAPDIDLRAGSESAPVPEIGIAGPRVKKGSVTTATGDLTVSAKAKDGSAVRLDLVDPTGRAFASGSPYKDDRAKVGTWKVTARAAKHQDESQSFQVPPDDVTVVKIDVKRLGDLTVTGRAVGGGAVRLDLVDPSGKALASGSPFRDDAAKPGNWKVTAKATGHEDATRAFEVSLGEAPNIALDLKPLGGLKVAGEPAGAAVKVTGPGGFKDDGGLPWEADGLASGTYQVEVSRTGYSTDQKEITVEAGRTATVAIKLEKGDAGGGGATAAGKAGVTWVSIPGGTFQMGSGENSDEKPAHSVTVRAFQMAKTEVTFKQYNACVAAGACPAAHVDDGSCYVWDGSSWKQGTLPSNFRGDDQPVVCVDWSQAQAFAKWSGGRLPTEAEWEYAARGGGKDRKYPWGDETANCSRAVMSDGGNGCGRGTTWPVCSKTAGNTPQGLCDLAGNVWEWVQDWYHSSYGGAPSDGSAWENPAGSGRVIRGGGWSSVASNVRAAYRSSYDPGSRYLNLGFRLARSPAR